MPKLVKSDKPKWQGGISAGGNKLPLKMYINRFAAKTFFDINAQRNNNLMLASKQNILKEIIAVSIFNNNKLQ